MDAKLAGAIFIQKPADSIENRLKLVTNQNFIEIHEDSNLSNISCSSNARNQFDSFDLNDHSSNSNFTFNFDTSTQKSTVSKASDPSKLFNSKELASLKKTHENEKFWQNLNNEPNIVDLNKTNTSDKAETSTLLSVSNSESALSCESKSDITQKESKLN